jgi:Cu/Zn superoxide dismutase
LLNAGLLFGALLAFGAGGFAALAGSESGGGGGRAVFARAVVTGPDGVAGTVEFAQRACPGCPTPGLTAPATDPGFESFPEPTVDVSARVTGLSPGAHGLHIHEVGSCVAPFTTAGGHFDPGPYANSNPDANHPYHMGDLPNLVANRHGLGRLRHTTSRITLSPGPLSVFDADGSAVIVHLNPDRGITGAAGASGGPRVACGVIQAES